MVEVTAAPCPLVSVGCAVYNGAETLPAALDGLVQQTYPSVEIIVCDDGSKDESVAIVRAYARRHPNIRFIENAANLGISRNCNQLFQLAHGKYFMWADQDDVRDPTFIAKCVPMLEADPRTVLCHSHTGVFFRRFGALMHVNTLDAVADDWNVVRRYWNFLRCYSDTTIYGLIRADALRATRLWGSDVGASNVLLFELLMLGKFRQVPETLYFYRAKGLKSRPSPAAEYARANAGRKMPVGRRPFVVVASNQTRSILQSRIGVIAKVALVCIVWLHVATVVAAKGTYRLLDVILRRRVPKWIEDACGFLVLDTRDIHFVVQPEEDREYMPEGWLLRKP